MALQVIGAGFGRTGTASLRDALEQLGFSKCYHMEDVFQRPADARVWDTAFAGKPVDWDRLFEGYRAAVDWPACTFYRELMEHYPDAKVILTVRDPERWYASAMATIYPVARAFPMSWLRRVVPAMRGIFAMHEHVIWNGTFHGRFLDKQYAIDVFNRHIEEALRAVPPERLLVYEVAQGWEPLCSFLNVPVPADQPFPHVNDTAEFQRQFANRARTLRPALAACVALATLIALGSWLLSRAARLRHDLRPEEQPSDRSLPVAFARSSGRARTGRRRSRDARAASAS